MDDIIDWGKNKLEGKIEPLHKRAIPDLSDLMKEEELEHNESLSNSTEEVITREIDDELSDDIPNKDDDTITSN